MSNLALTQFNSDSFVSKHSHLTFTVKGPIGGREFQHLAGFSRNQTHVSRLTARLTATRLDYEAIVYFVSIQQKKGTSHNI